MTERIRLDDLTSDQYDALYERLRKAERAADLLAGSHRRAEAALARMRDRYEVLAVRIRKLADAMRGSADTRWIGDQITAALDGAPIAAEAAEAEVARLRADIAGCRAQQWPRRLGHAEKKLRAAEAAIERVRGYVEHAPAADGPTIGLSPGYILALLDCDPMRTTIPAAGQPEPATITDPEWLRYLYARALRDAVTLPGKKPNAEEQVVLDDLTDAVMRVRDRHVAQLRQRLTLADATLREILTGGQITGDRITRWRAVLDELTEQAGP
jgi:hypothetical protein